MLSIHVGSETGLATIVETDSLAGLPADTVWIDLNTPTAQEEARIESWLGINVPTREEMREIEISSRLYEEDGALFMTVLALYNADQKYAGTTDVTFILKGSLLITVRHADPRPFSQFLQRAHKLGPSSRDGEFVLLGLIEAFIDRIADVLEHTGLDTEGIARDTFDRSDAKTKSKPMTTEDFKLVVARIGRAGDVTSKARESLVTISRVLVYLTSGAGETRMSKEVKLHIKTALRDANQLSDHASYLANKTVFLLDATMGLINIEQTNIIKIFSVAAAAMMPPTLIASIYGMNFAFMPELHEKWGYPVVLILMVLSALTPFMYFKRKGWL